MMADPLLMGMEWEMGVCTAGARSQAIDHSSLLDSLCHLAADRLPNLPGLGEHGIMLASGGRLYVDCGSLLEYASPECSDPADIVRSFAAMEPALDRLSREVAIQEQLTEVSLTRCNVDYRGNTYGAHESFLTRRDPRHLALNLYPFLASRVIFGAGGFHPRTATGCWFTLSPRAWYVTCNQSGSSTSDRGLLHFRDQPLAGGGFHRLHLLSEAVCSHRVLWLRMASTAMVIALADQGLLEKGVELVSPVDALRVFASDVTCRVKVNTRAGREMSAIEVQRHYLEAADRHVATLPSFAADAIDAWDGMLRQLETAPQGVGTQADFAIKHGVFSSHLKKNHWTWEMMEYWSLATDLLRRSVAAARPGAKPTGFNASYFLDARKSLAAISSKLESQMPAQSLCWEQLPDFFRLRQELFALDFRFSQLGKEGMFNRLDAAGVLDHRIPGVAITDEPNPPAPGQGRARLRGDVIRRFADQPDRYSANWTTVFDRDAQMTLDLNDPFETVERWVPQHGSELDLLSRPSYHLRNRSPVQANPMSRGTRWP